MMDKEKIVEAMETIKTICREHLECNGECPFYINIKGIKYDNMCYVRLVSPEHWFTGNINK